VIQAISRNLRFHEDLACVTTRSFDVASAPELQCSKTGFGDDSRRVSVQNATRKSESAAAESTPRKSVPGAKKAKLSVLLISGDDTLWPQIGAHVNGDLLLKQVDSIDEMLTATASGQPAIVLLDARNQSDSAGMLSRLQLHSARFAVVALDEAGGANAWTNAMALRQVVAHVAVPIPAADLTAALDSAREEVNARIALLGDGSDAASATAPPGTLSSGAASPAAPSGPRSIPWIPVSVIAGVLVVAAGAYIVLRPGDTSVKPAPAASSEPAQQRPAKPQAGADEKVDLLIERAGQAMIDRHFIDPADGSALTLYRSALLLDPSNGEALQGLQRLAEILFARAQSALDERKFDVALQALESARSISPGDRRLSALDERITSLRAELGPAQILATINAQNFDRAAQLIDEAARTKSLSGAKVAQLRDELRRRRQEADVANFVKLIDTRLQQDKLLEPRNDSAAYYLVQARAAGAGAAALQPQSQEIYKRLAQAEHAAIDQRHFADADRLLADLRTYGVPASTIASLQHDLSAARSQQAAQVPETPQYLDLAQSRLAQGKLTEPDNDSALFYVNQLRATDPKNSGLPRISSAVQGQILDQARAALDATQPARAEALLQMAAGLGSSPDLAALNQRLAQLKLGNAGTPDVQEASLTRVKAIELDYPADALRRNLEGWVDVAYVVTAEGKVTTVKVLDSSPKGVFEAAATRALQRMRYKPATPGGKPGAVSTKLRISFRMTK
jgi:TonB family protein